jgi:hypothetical protein
MGKTMGNVMCACILLLAARCGQGPDTDPAAELGGNVQALSAPSATSGAVGASAPQVTGQTHFCSNDALPAKGQVQQLAAQGTPFPEPDPFYRAPQDKDAWRRVTQASTLAPTLAPENVDSVDESEPGSAD